MKAESLSQILDSNMSSRRQREDEYPKDTPGDDDPSGEARGADVLEAETLDLDTNKLTPESAIDDIEHPGQKSPGKGELPAGGGGENLVSSRVPSLTDGFWEAFADGELPEGAYYTDLGANGFNWSGPIEPNASWIGITGTAASSPNSPLDGGDPSDGARGTNGFNWTDPIEPNIRPRNHPDRTNPNRTFQTGHQDASEHTDTLRAHCTLSLEQVVTEIESAPGIGELVECITSVFQAVERSRVNSDQWKLLRGRCVMVVRIAVLRVHSRAHSRFPRPEHTTGLLGGLLKVIAAQAQHCSEMNQGTEFLQFEAISEGIKRLFGALDSYLTTHFPYGADVARSQWVDEFRLVQEHEFANLNRIRQKLLGGDMGSNHSAAGQARPISKGAENLRSKRMSAGDMFECLLRHGCHDMTEKVDMKAISQQAVAAGAYGDIWKGKLNDGTDIAIKIWSFGRLEEAPQKSLKGAMRELYNWSKANHNNIQKLLGVLMFKGRLGMVSEWMGNGNLQDYVRRHRSVDRYQLCIGAARAVQHLHQEGMVHGDLKACNFLVSSDGVVKLTDFDHSIISCHSLIFSQTTTMGGGTMRWMAPELVMDEGDVELRSKKADVYALGMTILEIITGASPYSECQSDAQVFCKLSDKVLPVRTEHLQNRRGELLWELLVQCWDHEPTMRPSADQVVDRLRLLTDTTSPSNDLA